ncbi:probable pectinesterase/pectinesterase inhibitor 20 [Cucurbita moschata]|uniref:Probable pectinesterase/pectinesterase inhibitor 20 n=1 Tax=Cucurbita moschata TaxID=3662 RepID=A0A6J1G612_CUCMO|nr:probable pectinesterase/pectinesterase inhibitor 20 [Cucurbita moschata]
MGSSSAISLLGVLTLLYLFSFSSSAIHSPVPAADICHSTTSPSFCKAFLPNSLATVHSHCRFTLRHALAHARSFLALVDSHLALFPSLAALHDCRSLAAANLDFLSNTFPTVNTTTTTNALPFYKADEMVSLLSAVITNENTCYEGLLSSGSGSGSGSGSVDKVLKAISFDTKLYSLYLSLFKMGWVSNDVKAPHVPKMKHFGRGKGQLKLNMSPKNRAYYERLMHRRKPPARRLLQTNSNEDDGILVNGIVAVDPNGTYDFTTINAAIQAAPNNSVAADGYFLIFVTAGVYNESVMVPKHKKYVLMIGEGNNQTIITGRKNVPDGSTTFNSGTVIVEGTGFFGVNLTITNTAGPNKFQAVALRVSADMTTFYSCIFEGYQDTLYPHSLRQFYRECDIYGTIDFILGDAAVVFQNCNIYARLPMKGQYIVITAQGRTDPNQNTGISIHNCTIKPTAQLAASPTIKSYFGRPWKEYARTVYMQSFIDAFIDPAGWNVWDGTLNLNTSYYAEFNNSGLGSDTSRRAKWAVGLINATVANNFTVSPFLGGDQWLPPTTVPYTGGLIS